MADPDKRQRGKLIDADTFLSRRAANEEDGVNTSAVDRLRGKKREERLAAMMAVSPLESLVEMIDDRESSPRPLPLPTTHTGERVRIASASNEIWAQHEEDIPMITPPLERYLLGEGYTVVYRLDRNSPIFGREEEGGYRVVSTVNFVTGAGDLTTLLLDKKESALLEYRIRLRKTARLKDIPNGGIGAAIPYAGIAALLVGGAAGYADSFAMGLAASIGAAGAVLAGWMLAKHDVYEAGGLLPKRYAKEQVLARDDPERFLIQISDAGPLIGEKIRLPSPDEIA